MAMSLVSYEYGSTDEESDNDDGTNVTTAILVKKDNGKASSSAKIDNANTSAKEEEGKEAGIDAKDKQDKGDLKEEESPEKPSTSSKVANDKASEKDEEKKEKKGSEIKAKDLKTDEKNDCPGEAGMAQVKGKKNKGKRNDFYRDKEEAEKEAKIASMMARTEKVKEFFKNGIVIVAEDDEKSNISSDKDEEKKARAGKVKDFINDGHISDEEDDFNGQEVSIDELKKFDTFSSLSTVLPKPLSTKDDIPLAAANNEKLALSFSKLPKPKQNYTFVGDVNDADLKKKSDDTIKKNEDNDKPKDQGAKSKDLEKELVDKNTKKQRGEKGPVQITVPSMKEFVDVEKEMKDKSRLDGKKEGLGKKRSGLLDLLPKAKSEMNFAKSASRLSSEDVAKGKPAATIPKALIPDTVTSKRPAYNTEADEGCKNFNRKTTKVLGPEIQKQAEAKEQEALATTSNAASAATKVSEGDHSDEEQIEDFFSLNAKPKLPEVSKNEINALVAEKAAKMAEAKNQFLAAQAEKEAKEAALLAEEEEAIREAEKRQNEEKLDAEAMQALVGGTAKRRRKEIDEIQIMEISSDQVLPDREEWMRTALASSTEYQPTGVLVDEEPAAGTRRKHQITYLAHKAKANEAELQAMWATNRQTRRATQSKYGF